MFYLLTYLLCDTGTRRWWTQLVVRWSTSVSTLPLKTELTTSSSVKQRSTRQHTINTSRLSWKPNPYYTHYCLELEEASTHKSTNTHAGIVFLWLVTMTFDLFALKINGFPGLTLEQFTSGLVILAASVFEISCGKTDTHQTNRHAAVKTLPPRLWSACR